MKEHREDDEMCITRDEYKELIRKIETMLEIITRVDTDITIMKPEVQKTSKIVLGNGSPTEGLATKMTLLETAMTTHLATHNKRDDRAWDLGSPLLKELIRLVIFGGLMYFITNPPI